MRLPYFKQPAKRLRLLTVLGVLLIVSSGCAIDGAALLTDVVQAALDSATESVVDALSGHLARN
jgi:hypothetical protein